MKLIESKTLVSAAFAIEFTSIPQTFTDLVLVVSARHSGNDNGLSIQFNGSTANITQRHLFGTGSAAGSFSNYFTQVGLSVRTVDTSNTFSSNTIYIPNYTASVAKSYSGDGVNENNGTAAWQLITAGLFNSTSAITSLSVNGQATSGGNELQIGTTASLYGILKGSDGITVVS